MVSLNRVEMQKSNRRMIRALGPETLGVAELSGKLGRKFEFRCYRYPKWEVCAWTIARRT